jgi:small-conductance mechanosensitive channel
MPAPGRVGLTLAVILALWLIRYLAVRAVEGRAADAATVYRWRKASVYFAAAATLILIAFIWIEHVRSLATFLGLVSAGLAIALKDLVTGFAGWLFIMLRRPFDVGDRVQVGGFAGDVIDLRIFKFTLMEIGNWVDADQSTGRVIHVPNSKVLTEEVVNYSRGFNYLWNEIPVLVTFESNWKEAKRILQEAVDKHAGDAQALAADSLKQASRRFLLYYSHLTPTVYTSVKDSGVMLTIRHLCEPRKRRGVSQQIWEEILERFSERTDIDFAYPTLRYYDARYESKKAPEDGLERPEGNGG